MTENNSRSIEEKIKNLELKLNALNGQNNMLIINIGDKNKMNVSLQNEMNSMNSRLGQCMGENKELIKRIQDLQKLESRYSSR